MAHWVMLLVQLLLVGCASGRPTARRLDARLEAEIWLAIGQSNMEVFADKAPRPTFSQQTLIRTIARKVDCDKS